MDRPGHAIRHLAQTIQRSKAHDLDLLREGTFRVRVLLLVAGMVVFTVARVLLRGQMSAPRPTQEAGQTQRQKPAP